MKDTEFPLKAVKHLSNSNCNCQSNAKDVDLNKHWKSCMVGQAQKYLGRRVVEKPLWDKS